MQNRTRFLLINRPRLFHCSRCSSFPLAAASSKAKPEEVGLSSERLTRIHGADPAAHRCAATSRARSRWSAEKGRLAHLEAQGVMDLASKKPMATDTIFHLASMTKPIAGVAILMLMEEGKLRLDRSGLEVHSGAEVAERRRSMEPGPAPAGGGAAPSRKFYTVPAAREITIRDLLTHTSGLVSGGISATEAAKMPRKPTRHAGRLHPAARRSAARFPAGLALDLQPRRRLRHPGTHRRGRLGPDVRRVSPAAHLRAARDEGHIFLSAGRSAGARRDHLPADAGRRCEGDGSARDAEQDTFRAAAA